MIDDPLDLLGPFPRDSEGWPNVDLGQWEAEDIFEFCMRASTARTRWWFRGEAGLFSTMLPGLSRDGPVPLHTEIAALSGFARSAWPHADPLQQVYLRSVAMDPLRYSAAAAMIMQQHGGKTRLVDWTESPFMAAFIVACDRPDEDGRIWCIRHDALVLFAGERWNDFEHERRPDGQVDYDALITRGPERWICPLGGSIAFDRLHRQLGAFTMAGDANACHRSLLSDLLLPEHRRCLVIPGRVKARLTHLLSMAGTSAMSLGIPMLDLAAARFSSPEPLSGQRGRRQSRSRRRDSKSTMV